MPEVSDEPFSNPLPPPAARKESEDSDAGVVHMTNKDFRQLLMTPRAKPGEAPPTRRETGTRVVKEYNEDDDPRARRRKKKSFYAKLKKQEMEKEAELARKYRDRAKERREGKTDYDDSEVISTTANYRAVAPDAKHDEGAANRRKQLIEESKYLGGDMEHTHLVKGLDYALLQKVRAEITTKEKTEEDEMESSFQSSSKDGDVEDTSIQFKTRMARNVYRTLFKKKPPVVNELFLPGRMAYQVELEDEYAESDIPTTIIRSKADCPTLESHTNLTTNDIVINKLTQILSYLRQGQRNKKMKKKEKGKMKEDKAPVVEENIFGDIGNYVPDYTKKSHKDKEKEKPREQERSRDRRKEGDGDRRRDGNYRDKERERKPRSYFEKPKVEEEPMDVQGPSASSSDFVKKITEKYSSKAPAPAPAPAPPPVQEERFAGTLTTAELKAEKREREKGIALQGANRQHGKSRGAKIDSYMECYPGAAETADALEDSDEEADYSKMDMGNKKGPIGRWDFETAEEYSTYMNQKEAMPKAAFQFGIKMSEGRKTRRMFTEKNEKAALDREWQQISQIISKRKTEGGGGGSSEKKPRT